MIKLNGKQIKLKVLSAFVLGSLAFNGQAATATFDASSGIVDLPVVEVLNGGSSSFFNAQLQLVDNGELQLIGASPAANAKGQQRNVFDSATTAVHIPSITVGADDFYVKLKVIPGSDPLRFKLDQLVNNQFQGCPDFSAVGPTEGSCILSGEINKDITLTKNTTWIISGPTFIGGDNTNSATLTINPGTKIFGQAGLDFLWIRRGSKIMAEGTPDNPIIMSGSQQQRAGEWGGLVLTGNAPVNGCNADVVLCEIPFEAVTTELLGGNDIADNSGLIKYTQILFAGFAVRPNEELNGLTLNAVGSGTVLDFIHIHNGLDDGVEMFGGTAQMKHMYLTNNGDDNLDWGLGWRGRAQFILTKQINDGDRGIEADNNKSGDLQPRSRPILSNMTMIGAGGVPGVGTFGALLRRGTGANISNSVFTDFPVCLEIDGAPTFDIAGSPGNLTGELTITNTFVNCPINFTDGKGATFTTAEWFLSQQGNKEGDPLLNGFLPATGSPLTLGGAPVNDDFFDNVDYAGAFKDDSDDWTQEWTFKFN